MQIVADYLDVWFGGFLEHALNAEVEQLLDYAKHIHRKFAR